MPTSRPQVGQKTPKSSFPLRKCINVHCKEEKEQLNATISSLREQIVECECRLLFIHLLRVDLPWNPSNLRTLIENQKQLAIQVKT